MSRWANKGTWIPLLLFIAIGTLNGTSAQRDPDGSRALLFLGCILITAASIFHFVADKKKGWKMGLGVGMFTSGLLVLGWIAGAKIHAMTAYAMWFKTLILAVNGLLLAAYLLPGRKFSTYGS